MIEEAVRVGSGVEGRSGGSVHTVEILTCEASTYAELG